MSFVGSMLPERLRYPAWCWKKYVNEAEIRLASRLALKGSRCIDVGANAGAYSYFMRRAGARVEAFEPIPELVLALKRHFKDSINIHQVAASNANGVTEIYAPVVSGHPLYGYASCENSWPENEQVHLTVPTRTIDSFEFDDVSFMKIDVEGYELAVLEGARETLERCKPSLIIEAEERHRTDAVNSIAKFLGQFGYKGEFVANGVTNRLEDFSTAIHQARPETPGYICNFIFKAAHP